MGCLDEALGCYFAEQWDHDHLVLVAERQPPPARHRDRTHTPVKYAALHSWFFLSDAAAHETTQTVVGCAGKANVAVCFTVLWMGGKPWTM